MRSAALLAFRGRGGKRRALAFIRMAAERKALAFEGRGAMCEVIGFCSMATILHVATQLHEYQLQRRPILDVIVI